MTNKIQNFYDLNAWQEAHQLTLATYKITREFPKEELYGLISQLKRATSSITANIAEGFARYHFKDKIRFYYQSRGSVAEVQSFLILAKDLGYINSQIYQELTEQSHNVAQLINGLIRAIEKQK